MVILNVIGIFDVEGRLDNWKLSLKAARRNIRCSSLIPFSIY